MFFSNKTRQKMQLARVAAAGLVNNYPHLNLENTLDLSSCNIWLREPNHYAKQTRIKKLCKTPVSMWRYF